MQATAILYFTRSNLYNFVAAPAWLAHPFHYSTLGCPTRQPL